MSASTIRKSAPQSRAPDDINSWLDELGLHRQKLLLNKNIGLAVADAVLVAEIIHAKYPKLIQLHSYVEQNNISGRKTNWELLNRKALKPLRCEVSDEQIETFVNRRQPSLVIDFLRFLRAKIPAFEPLYLSDQYTATDPVMQRRHSSILAANRLPIKSAPSPPPPSTPTPSTSTAVEPKENVRRLSKASVSTTRSKSISSNNVKSPDASGRRPSMMMTNKIMKDRQDREEIRRRASMMTSHDLDQMYKKFSDKLRRENEDISRQVDVMDQRSAVMDAKLNALREQNKAELKKSERRLSQYQLEQHEAETASALALIDDEAHYHLHNPNRSFEISQQLSNIYSDDGNSMATPPQPHQRLSRLWDSGSIATQEDDEVRPDGESVEEERAMLSRMSTISESDYELESEGEGDEEESDEESPPPPPPAEPETTPIIQVTIVNEKPQDSADTNASKSPILTETQVSPRTATVPTVPSNIENQNPVAASKRVNYIRYYSAQHDMFFFTPLVYNGDVSSEDTGNSTWTTPTSGIVYSRDVKTGDEYYTDTATGKSSWNLEDL